MPVLPELASEVSSRVPAPRCELARQALSRRRRVRCWRQWIARMAGTPSSIQKAVGWLKVGNIGGARGRERGQSPISTAPAGRASTPNAAPNPPSQGMRAKRMARRRLASRQRAKWRT